ncbi:MAG TPA: sigma-54 dependent transcriptional regulator [Pyrinomonadaceae bacterium]|jgi:transcriptional regulator with GAF, ATPase, and Fis domain|nr:sigma-54 dependent transcriptional regulator [Pyrinomonadaceae bacterium]
MQPLSHLKAETDAPVDSKPDVETTAHACRKSVLVWNGRSRCAQLLKRIIESCAAAPVWVHDYAAAGSVALAADCSVALIALDECPASDAPVLDVIRTLKRRGFRVLCFAERTAAWPLGQRCQPLLAGALGLYDSAAPEFTEKLQQSLAQLLRAAAVRLDEEEQIKSEMRRLGVIGESPAMISVFRWVLRVSVLSDLPVLIIGETGTGKELLVNAICQLDEKRRQGPLVALNCSAISPALAESELFGHRRGAFTGADRDRKGLFRSAQGGILFLDEIGDLDTTLQAKLLRVLQENCVLGVGEEREVPVSVRVIAATNRNLQELVKNGNFRTDLFHRLNLLSLYIPPLRERPADLRPLIEHFLKKYRALSPSDNLQVDAEFVEALAQVELPGNARQLENLVRRALVNKETDSPLNLSDLPPEVWQELSEQKPQAAFAGTRESIAKETSSSSSSFVAGSVSDLQTHMLNLLDLNEWNLSQSLEQCERLMVESALQHTQGNQTQTAKLLGITPRSVYNKLRKHHIH